MSDAGGATLTGMRGWIAMVSVAVMLLPLVAVGGRAQAPVFPEVATPAPVPHGRAVDHPHPCTPYAGCVSVTLASASQTP